MRVCRKLTNSDLYLRVEEKYPEEGIVLLVYDNLFFYSLIMSDSLHWNNQLYHRWVDFSTRNFPELKKHKSNFQLFNDAQFRELFKNAPAMILVVNHAEQKYEFFSENVKEILGYDAQEFYEGHVPFGLSLFFPDHVKLFTDHVFPAVFNAIENYKETGVKKLRLSYNFKYKRKDGQYVWLAQQMSVLETDRDSNPLLSMYFMSDITPLKKDDKIDFVISVLDDQGYFSPCLITSFPDEKQLELTIRELEILKLISGGKSSQNIADQLGISKHTVNTHRKNMLDKTGANNTSELISWCIVRGVF